ncbi:MAG: hypothetical protein AB8G26_06060 [Ilumatobacter sp.]
MAARLDALILCDFAQVRDGLLFVQSGGLTRLVAQTFPATFHTYVAAMVNVPSHEAADAHRMVMKVKAAETAKLVATVDVAMHERPLPRGLQPGESRQVPLVIPLQKVIFPRPGQYDVQVDIDEQLAGDLNFRVEHRPPPSPT